jgi:signal recognition particle receptor subunit beta
MAFIRPEEKEINFKIVYWGPASSGKTTCLNCVKELVKASKKGKIRTLEDPERTLFFDFLPLKLDKIKGLSARFNLYTVPGQAPYAESRSFLLKGVDGIAVVLDSQIDRGSDNAQCLEEMASLLTGMGANPQDVPIVFVYNKQDLPNRLTLEEMNALYNPLGLPAFTTIAARGEQVMESLTHLIGQTLEAGRKRPL